ncbi:hypothetical protein PBI_DEWDROP_73 [Microbacterium phage Dewdrop]|nr:hypothetical protein PBI_LEAF_73 [Microbacterium phage Leaf]QGZ17441.1 hypothetical protein PBI_DEWDROP_73 [Microbacterium phage Dewdrop]
MAGGAHIKMDRPKWGRIVSGITRASTLRAAENLKSKLKGEIYSAGRVNTGEMADDWNITEVPARTRFGYKVAVSSPHKKTIYQNYGTRGSRPVKAKALRFSPGGGPMIFRTRSGPIAAARFMERAHGSMSLRDWLR